MSLKETILAAQDIETAAVECPEWGCTVQMKAPTGAERDEFELQMTKGKGKQAKADLRNIRARTVAKFAVDETGARLFDDGDAIALGEKAAKPLDRCFTAWLKLAGMNQEEIDEVAENLD